jgi:hypothetical protein
MMIVNFEIAFAADLQIEETVLRKEFEHVLKKRQSNRDLRSTGAV